MSVALVVPTCRPDSFRDFLAAWEPYRWWDRLVVVEDRPERTEGLAPPDAVHISHAEIDADLDCWAGIISRRDSAIRSYGFLVAYRLGADWIVTLDDDTRPHPGFEDLAAGHAKPLERFTSSVPGLRVRGLPYGDRGTIRPAASIGLWSGVPDLDAITSLAIGCPTDWQPPPGRRLVPRGQYVPMCGMNLAFRREVAPLFYFGLQGDGWLYHRFDDIWAGLWAKKGLDHLGLPLAVGEPFVRHERASDPFVNLRREASGVAFHETFWRLIADAPAQGETPSEFLSELGLYLSRQADPYTARLGVGMGIWAAMFSD